ncbi:hypothetical protein HU230_0014000 [Bradyrhizobium quebecense]|uniref:Uncharacterized protein n=1 Tax=Bradyrhizobium quebecense TaxID=2748629 RepID=A0A974AGG6_9BRAD|nr:hypothetical protein [Bradyrhizobium quebecense]UGA47086.1 hypothetical protein HU230_0014000 [Bradyrhizobium quebecense]
MPAYQAYVLGKDGHIKQRLDLSCPDDDMAKERARSLVDGRTIELWKSDRKLATFEPNDPMKAGTLIGWLKSCLRPPN